MQTQPAGSSVGTLAFHALDYDPVDNVFIFITDSASGRRTWAYRYGGGTPSTSAPIISNILASSITANSATISWTTNIPSTTKVEYGPTTSYGSSTPLDSTLLTSHSVTLSGLNANTLYHYRVSSADAAGNLAVSTDQTFMTLTATVLPTPTPAPTSTPSSTPPPSSGSTQIGGVLMPSLQDEKNTYRSWGWTWSTSQEPNFPSDSTYVVSDPDIHGETEGDDLWTYLMMYRRTGQKGYLDRATAWANYFENVMLTCPGDYYTTYCYDRDAFGLDHAYGWGLLAWYEYTGDTKALTTAESIGADIEAIWSKRVNNNYPVPGQFSMSYYGARQPARHLLLITRLAEVTRKQRWIDLRDKLIDLWLQSPDWDSNYGMYFVGDWQTDYVAGAGTYASGVRMQSSFSLAILGEAFEHAYRTTGRAELRNRMIAMARFVDKYGLDPVYQYTSSWFGIKNGQSWQKYSAQTPVTFWDPVYTESLVNILVRGYKYTGDRTLYDRAKYFFNRGTKGIYGEPVKRAASDTQVGHFIDTIFDSSSGNFYLGYNKGELQYTYAIFENGGSPTVLGTVPPSPTPVSGSTPTVTPTPKPTATPTPTPKPASTATPTPKPTATPIQKPKSVPTATPTPTPKPASTATPIPTPASNSNELSVTWGNSSDMPVPEDYDGDKKADIATWRSKEGNWYVALSTGNPTIQTWGTSGDKPVPDDYDGDGRADFAVFRPSTGTWYILRSSGKSLIQKFGSSSDIPVPGDYDGDGIADMAIFRPSTGGWAVIPSHGGDLIRVIWGQNGDIPVPADYDGDGKADMAVWRPSTGTWYIKFSSGIPVVIPWGANGDIPVPADYDGDGRADMAVWRPSTGTWYILLSTGGIKITPYGLSQDVPVPRDYDGDQRADIAVWRPKDGSWHILFDKLASTITPAPVPASNTTFALKSVTISGQVKDMLGRAISGVRIILSGTQVKTTQTDRYGNYRFEGLTQGGDYTLTPSKERYLFNPKNQPLADLMTDMVVNFTGIR
jgi:putative transposon-encoded protein